MRRREFIAALAGAAIAGPQLELARAGEQMRRIAIMVPLPANDPVFQRNFVAFADAMTKAGWVEGQ